MTEMDERDRGEVEVWRLDGTQTVEEETAIRRARLRGLGVEVDLGDEDGGEEG